MGIREGQTVVDIGAGKGYLTIPASTIVGKAGLVYSVEPNRARSSAIRERVVDEGLQNVRVITTGAEQLGEIPSETVDLSFSAHSFHHFSDKQVAVAEIRRILRRGGTFYVWDWTPNVFFKHGTRPEELTQFSSCFATSEVTRARRAVRAKFTK